MLRHLRFGRGLDNRKLKATGYRYRYTTREAVLKLREHQRTATLTRGVRESYRYEEEVEEFLRRSPSVRRVARPERRANLAAGASRSASPAPAPPAGYADLQAKEVIALLSSLEPEALRALRDHEQRHAARKTVLAAMDALLAGHRAA
jgi:UDP-glucose 4-epimerase